MAAEALISVRDLEAGYGGPAVIRSVSLEIRARKMMTFVGPNGAGKSTLLASLYGIARTYRGEILFEGERVESISSLDRFGKGMAFVPQGRCNFPQMNVWENLEIAAHSISRESRRAARSFVLDLFPILGERLKTPAGNLSGGEQQLLEMAMVLQTRPRCLMVDEPSLGLSPAMQGDIFAKLSELRDQGMTLVVVEQNVRKVLAVSDDASVLVQGEIVMSGAASSVVADDKIRHAYLGG